MNFVVGDTIYFTALSWEAVAALVVGLAAVLGAIWVGLRQADILSRQTDMQERQASLQQLELRRALFDRRYPVYLATRAWIGHINSTGNIPGRGHDLPLHDLPGRMERTKERERQAALQQEFLSAIDLSRFVFSPHVFDELERLWVDGNQLQFHVRRAMRMDDKLQHHLDRQADLEDRFRLASQELAGVFGNELRVSDGGESTFRPLELVLDQAIADD